MSWRDWSGANNNRRSVVEGERWMEVSDRIPATWAARLVRSNRLILDPGRDQCSMWDTWGMCQRICGCVYIVSKEREREREIVGGGETDRERVCGRGRERQGERERDTQTDRQRERERERERERGRERQRETERERERQRERVALDETGQKCWKEWRLFRRGSPLPSEIWINTAHFVLQHLISLQCRTQRVCHPNLIFWTSIHREWDRFCRYSESLAMVSFSVYYILHVCWRVECSFGKQSLKVFYSKRWSFLFLLFIFSHYAHYPPSYTPDKRRKHVAVRNWTVKILVVLIFFHMHVCTEFILKVSFGLVEFRNWSFLCGLNL